MALIKNSDECIYQNNASIYFDQKLNLTTWKNYQMIFIFQLEQFDLRRTFLSMILKISMKYLLLIKNNNYTLADQIYYNNDKNRNNIK